MFVAMKALPTADTMPKRLPARVEELVPTNDIRKGNASVATATASTEGGSKLKCPVCENGSENMTTISDAAIHMGGMPTMIKVRDRRCTRQDKLPCKPISGRR